MSGSLPDVIIEGTNFLKTDLSGVDFTTSNKIVATIFRGAHLANSNFEGVNLSPKQSFEKEFKNIGRDIIEGDYSNSLSLFRDLGYTGHINGVGYIGFENVHIISNEINGNNITLKFIFYNNFSDADLENANFKNSGLWFANFYSANLTNANLSGADLRKVTFVNADLSNANLQGANIIGTNLGGANLSGADLTGATYDETTVLRCLNHTICVN